jgi:hypothetical protein
MNHPDDIVAGGVTRRRVDEEVSRCPSCARPSCGRPLAQHHRRGLYLACVESGCEHFQDHREVKK